jgi:hypothetical protein
MSDETYDNWLALLSPSQRRHRGRLSAKLTRGDDGGASRPSSYRCNVEEPENPLPCPLSSSVRIFPFQSIRQSNPTEPFLEIFLMLDSIRLLVTGELDILDPKATALH